MRLLADANVESKLVEWLRLGGHDVVWAADLAPATSDEELLDRANAEERVILTHDRDFGELVFRSALSSHGIILMRFRASRQAQRLALLQRHWGTVEQRANGRFLVLTDHRIRVRALPLFG
jgi:predicted nuclease of predicted toxin-antitoxin system